MNRAGYSDDWDSDNDANLALGRWRGAVRSAIRGRRGQAFLRDLLGALQALPDKRLITGRMEADGCVCAIGALGRARGVDLAVIDRAIEEVEADEEAFGADEVGLVVAKAFNIAPALAREIMFENDTDAWAIDPPDTEAAERRRYARVVRWVEARLRGEPCY